MTRCTSAATVIAGEPTCEHCKTPMRLVYTGFISKLYDYYRCDGCGHAQHAKRSRRDPQTRLF